MYSYLRFISLYIHIYVKVYIEQLNWDVLDFFTYIEQVNSNTRGICMSPMYPHSKDFTNTKSWKISVEIFLPVRDRLLPNTDFFKNSRKGNLCDMEINCEFNKFYVELFLRRQVHSSEEIITTEKPRTHQNGSVHGLQNSLHIFLEYVVQRKNSNHVFMIYMYSPK